MKGSRSRRRLRIALFVGVGLALTGISLVAYGTNVFRQLEFDSVHARFAVRGVEPPPPELVIVQIDDVTFNELGEQWPFPRSMHGRVIDRLTDDGARAIVYDIQFTEATEEDEDNALIDAVDRARNVVLATTEVGPNGESNVFGGDDVVQSVGARAGNALLPPDPGGALRRLPYSVDGLVSLPVAAAEVVLGRRIDAADFRGETVWIDYHGPPGTIPAVSFSDVLQGDTEPGFFRDKIVVVGPSAPSLQDVHPTSTTGADENMSGAEIQANSISTVLRGLPLRSAPGQANLGLVVLLGLFAPLASLLLSLRWTLAVAVAAAVTFAVGAQVAFEQGTLVSFVYPFGALAISTAGATGAHYLLAAFERERVRDVFSRFVPDKVVEQVLARTDDDLRLGGVEMVGTSMFTDLRGFTSHAESLQPARVIDVVNHYLSEMSDAILAHGGTLVAFMGDGIFAVFGAPIEQEDHADRALECSREMLEVRLPRFNAWMQEEGLGTGFRMGIGLNTGPFISGNVGSERRLEYAAIGDTTNTAARLEGMTKGTPYQLFFSDTTKEALRSEVEDAVYVDEFDVRGRQQKVKLWSLRVAADPEEVPAESEPTAAPG